MQSQSDLENSSNDVVELNNTDHFCDMDKRLITHSERGYLSCFALQISSWWRRLQSLTEEKKSSSDGEGEEAEGKEGCLEVEQTASSNTRATIHYQHSPRRRMLDLKSAEEQAVHFPRIRLSFSDAIDTVYYDAPEEMILTSFGWTDMMSDIPDFRKKNASTRPKERNL